VTDQLIGGSLKTSRWELHGNLMIRQLQMEMIQDEKMDHHTSTCWNIQELPCHELCWHPSNTKELHHTGGCGDIFTIRIL